MPSKQFIREVLKISREAVRTAGKEIIKIQKKKKISVGFKQDTSPITRGDQVSEQIIIDKISTYFPQHRILSEESGKVNFSTQSDFLWVIDPIDGTWSYLNHEITICIQLALIEDDNIIASVIYNPLTDGLYQASNVSPSMLNMRRLPFINYEQADEAVVNYHISSNYHESIIPLLEMWRDKKIAKLISQGGSLAYSLACIAKGSHTCFVALKQKKDKLNPWDLCSGVYLIRNMGGKVTDIMGKDIDPMNHCGGFIASSNEKVHYEFITLLQKYKF